MRPPSSDDVRALTERLIETPSVSPDPVAENRIAAMLLDAMPEGVERGTWPLEDGRRVVWGRLRGGGRRALLVLGHFDTVGVEEYADLGDPGAALAFRPRELRERLIESGGAPGRSPTLASDLEEERRRPGTWLFGRGSLDMKSGIAAGIAALGALARAKSPSGDVVLVITPDEEHESAGMLEAVPHLARLAEAESLAFAGALNLDYSNEPVAYAGVLGKALAGIWVRGVPTHAGDPFAGMDAIQLAAAIARRLSASTALRDVWQGRPGPPPVALKLRDLKTGYNVQTAPEAVMEWNVLTYSRPLEATFASLEREVRVALDDVGTEMRALSGGSAAWHTEPMVRSLAALAPWVTRAAAPGPRAGEDPRAFSLRVVRESVAAAGIEGPVVVPYLLPPFYPAALPRNSAWMAAAGAALEREGVEVRPLYPFISDASYVSWRGAPVDDLATHMPAWNRSYRLPIAAMTALDLDVINLGPWGRDAHGVGERVNTAWTFERLPALLARVIEAGLAES